MAFAREFREFISRGNVIDLAVAVIVGGAFGNIVTSLVNDIFVPVLGILSGGMDLKGLQYQVPSIPGLERKTATIAYGNFLQNTFDFLIKAVAIFLFLKGFTSLKRRIMSEKEITPSAPLSIQETLLVEIRDLLKTSLPAPHDQEK